jgi:F420H(2)-dependent quinone reductase
MARLVLPLLRMETVTNLSIIQANPQTSRRDTELESTILKAFFRTFLSLFVWLYQRTNGKFGGKIQGLAVLLLTTTGRRTGKKRTTPLGYFEQDGYYVITASNAGSDSHPAWFYNLKSHPQVMLQIRDKQLTAIAEPANPTLRQQLWAELVKRAPGYGAYEKRTTREIPIVLLQPVP